jgi:hypothetical protein
MGLHCPHRRGTSHRLPRSHKVLLTCGQGGGIGTPLGQGNIASHGKINARRDDFDMGQRDRLGPRIHTANTDSAEATAACPLPTSLFGVRYQSLTTMGRSAKC